MRIAIRTDGASHIGIGHVMRCLTLANALQKRGGHVRFVSRHLSGHLRAMISDRGHELSLLEGVSTGHRRGTLTHAHWLDTGQEVDADETIRALAAQSWDWLVVDHYALDAMWEGAMRTVAKQILVIDDIADRAHDCDLLLDQNLYPDMDVRYVDKVPARCGKLLGPCYALLRPEFKALRDATAPRDGSVRRVLILLGGSDAHDETEKAIQAVAWLRSEIGVDVVIGANHSQKQRVQGLCEQHRFDCHVQASNVAALMAKADVAIGATGSTSWERCCLGVPALCVTVGENQVPIAEGLAAHGAIVNLGWSANVSADDMSRALQQLVRRPAALAAMSVAAWDLVDGQGVERVCEKMTGAA